MRATISRWYLVPAQPPNNVVPFSRVEVPTGDFQRVICWATGQGARALLLPANGDCYLSRTMTTSEGMEHIIEPLGEWKQGDAWLIFPEGPDRDTLLPAGDFALWWGPITDHAAFGVRTSLPTDAPPKPRDIGVIRTAIAEKGRP